MLLFVLSFSTLLSKFYVIDKESSRVVKRKLDSGKAPRPWAIFFMDVSKQGFSAGMLHLYNILASRALSETDLDGSTS